MLKSFNISVIVLFFFIACSDKEELIDPSIYFDFFEQNDSIYLAGSIKNIDLSEIQEKGFLINISDTTLIDEFNSYIVKSSSRSLQFEDRILNDFMKDSAYYGFCYVITSYGSFFSSSKRFYGLGFGLPIIEHYEPTQGDKYDFVKFYGSNFGHNKNDIKVLFGDLRADVISCTDNRLVVKVPEYQFSDTVAIQINKFDKLSAIVSDFFLEGPVITEFDPKEGGIGKWNIRIIGQGFSNTPWHNFVEIGGQKTKTIESSETELLIEADLNSILPMDHYISVTVDEITGISDSYFKVLSPWKRLSDFPGPQRGDALSININNKLYVGFGVKLNELVDPYYSDLWEFNPLTNSWKELKAFPSEWNYSSGGFSFVIDGIVYLGGAHHIQTIYGWLPDFWSYDPEKDSWTKKTDFPGNLTGKKWGGFTINGKGYVLQTVSKSSTSNKRPVWEYDPTSNSWTEITIHPDNTSGTLYHFSIGSDIYTLSSNKEVYKYSPEDNIWVQLNDVLFDFDMNSSPLFCSNDTIAYGIAINWFYKYNPKNDLWMKAPIFPGEIASSMPVIVNSKLYFGTDEFWSFDIY